jgi:hypothetical protein
MQTRQISTLNPLTPQNLALWSHTPRTDTTLTQDTPCPISPTVVRLDLLIEKTLNTLSLFQKPIQLFSAKQFLATSLSALNPSLTSNYEGPSTIWPTQYFQNKSIPNEFLYSTANNSSNDSPVPAKASHSYNKQTRKSPYNIRPFKKPSLPSQDKPLSPIPRPPLPPLFKL